MTLQTSILRRSEVNFGNELIRDGQISLPSLRFLVNALVQQPVADRAENLRWYALVTALLNNVLLQTRIADIMTAGEADDILDLVLIAKGTCVGLQSENDVGLRFGQSSKVFENFISLFLGCQA